MGLQVLGGRHQSVSNLSRQRDVWTSDSECVCPGVTEQSVFE